MEGKSQFRQLVQAALEDIGPDTLRYDESEFWMIRSAYEYVEYYAQERRLFNTAVALPLARALHNGSHRKSSVTKNGVSCRLPYVIHCIMVCRMLADLDLPMSDYETDIVLASALCHDMIEDIPFPDGGRELYTRFHLDPRVFETVKHVSKRKDFTPEEELAFFHGIETDPFALLVKLSDRGNNVEDLYNMSAWKVHEYVAETEKFFLPMCTYAVEHYPGLVPVIEILQNKIISLIETAEVLVDRYEKRQQDMLEEVRLLKAENDRLRAEWEAMRE